MTEESATAGDFFHGDVPGGIERIRRRLLDLTNRNRLLNFRYTKRNSLRIVDELPDQLFEVLSDEREFTFTPIPRPRRGSTAAGLAEPASGRAGNGGPSAVEHARTLGISTSFDLPAATQHAPAPRHADREIQTLHFPEELESILRSMASTARLAIEETGSNMLYLVFGFLDWYESDDSDQVRSAPLLLFPVALERGLPDSRDGVFRYRVRHSGEDVFANLCLQEKLKQDFGLALPDLDVDELPEAYFRRVTRIVSQNDRWAVRRHATMTLLSFGKMLMYHDLDSRKWPSSGGPAAHPRVREFFEGRKHENVSLGGDYRIDEVDATASLPVLIDDADSSQHSVLIDARRGQNLVVMGPPGTGKSQTITNLIAAAISEGRRVLFVSEKLAALEVVRHRLDRAKLGIFCLELHSHKTQKKALIDDLRTRLNVRGRFRSPALFDEKLTTLKAHKRDLVAYVDLIGRKFGGLNQTVHDVLWAARRRRSALPEQSALLLERVRYTGAETVTLAGFERLRDQFSDFATHLANVIHDRGHIELHPWFGISAPNLTFRDERALTEPLETIQNAAAELQVGIDELAAFGVEIEPTPTSIEGIVAGIASLTTSPNDVIPEMLAVLDHTGVREKLERFCKLVTHYRDLHQKIVAALGQVPPLAAADAEVLASSVSRDSGAIPSAYDIAALRTHLADVREIAADLRKSGTVTAALERALGTSPVATGQTLPLLTEALRAALSVPVDALGYRNPHLQNESAVTLLEGAERAAEPIRAEREALAARLVLDFAPSPVEARRYAAAAANARWWKPWDGEWRVARNALATMSRGNTKPTPAQAKAEFQTLAVYLEKVRTFEADPLHREVAVQAFRGIDTPFRELAGLAKWYKALQGQLAGDSPEGAKLVEAFWAAPSDLLQTLRAAVAGGQLLRALEIASSALHAIRSALHADHHPSHNEPLDIVAERLAALASRCEETTRSLSAVGFVEQTPLDHSATVLRRVVEFHETAAAAMADVRIPELLGRHFAGPATDVECVFRTFILADEIRGSTLPDALKRSLLHVESPARIRALKEWAGRMRPALATLTSAWNTFSRTGAVETGTWLGNVPPDIAAVRTRVGRALSARQLLPEWLDYQRARKTAADARLGSILALAERGEIPPQQVVPAFEYVFTYSLVQGVFEAFPGLARFNGITHEEARSRFAALDRETIRLERERIAAVIDSKRVPPGNDFGPVASKTELALIQRETEKQKRHVPIRQLVRRAGAALQALKPCFMMGPLSVAQYLEPDALAFDLVVMDEASQLRPEDALGAICRGSQVVIVGDPMQLPPTNFFDRIGEDDVDEEDLAQGLAESESILDIARSIYRPTRMLRWHYRSRHADLIAFSNREFYDNELVVFPSPVTRSHELGIRFIHVPTGRFEGRRNVAEAQKVVEAVLRHAREHPEDSLGVVTLNLNQREAIENELEQRLKDEPALQAFVDRHQETLQPLFVKNLENVQGDERDVIFVSVTYGPDRHGNVYQRFGPINGPVGHRRLNVLFTRAKRRLIVFSSLLAEQIRVGPDSSRGLRALKGYLQFAQTGVLESAHHTGRAPDSDFEVEVARALRDRGYDVVAQVGVSGFFIDLGVKHPAVPDRYLLGIECDGATYHSSRSARDRDRLREEILKSLGWAIHRIWSTDWLRAPEVEIARVVGRLDGLLAEERGRVAVRSMVEDEEEPLMLPEAQVFDLTSEQARTLLVELRETKIRSASDDALKGCILRDVMVDAFLKYRPLDRTEWQDRIPLDLRLDTEPEQTRYLDEIFSILSRVS